MNNINVSIEFNQDNKLAFIVKGNVEDELIITDEIKTKINKLIEKSDTSNVLTRLNSNYTTELDTAIQVAFEKAVNKEYEEKFKNK